MKKFVFILLALVFAQSALADKFIAKGDDTAIVSNICLYATDGVTKITNITSEEAGLKITITSSDHATLQLYDVVGEIEPITTFGTWLAPTALNVRFEADPTTGCYELQFLANSFEDGIGAVITIEDTSAATFMEADVQVQIRGTGFFDLMDGTTSLMTSRQAGNALETTITTATSQTELDLAAGASNDDAYNNMTAVFVGETEECERQITDYTGTGAILFIRAACSFTLAPADTVRIHAGASGDAQQIAQLDLDITTGPAGVVLGTNTLTASVLAADATTEITAAVATSAALATVQSDLDALTRTIAIFDTTIATLATQVSFTLTAGPADDNAINGCMILVTDQADATQIAFAGIQDYAQATKTVTLDADPGIFAMAATDLATISCYGVSAEFMNKAEILGVGNSGDKWRGN